MATSALGSLIRGFMNLLLASQACCGVFHSRRIRQQVPSDGILELGAIKTNSKDAALKWLREGMSCCRTTDIANPPTMMLLLLFVSTNLLYNDAGCWPGAAQSCQSTRIRCRFDTTCESNGSGCARVLSGKKNRRDAARETATSSHRHQGISTPL